MVGITCYLKKKKYKFIFNLKCLRKNILMVCEACQREKENTDKVICPSLNHFHNPSDAH